jgi:hypothetical protein
MIDFLQAVAPVALAAVLLAGGCGGAGAPPAEPDGDAVEEPSDAGDPDERPEREAEADPTGGDADADADAGDPMDVEEEEIAPTVDPPDELGPYLVGTFDDSFTNAQWGEFVLTAYYPAVYDGWDYIPAVDDAPYPGVAFIHGFMGNKDSNEWIGWHIGSWGYVAVLVGVPDSLRFEPQQWADGLKGAITTMLEKNGEEGPLEGMVDGDRVAVAGHSMGSMGAILATSQDERIGTSVLMAAACSRLGENILVLRVAHDQRALVAAADHELQALDAGSNGDIRHRAVRIFA